MEVRFCLTRSVFPSALVLVIFHGRHLKSKAVKFSASFCVG